ncbi:phasin family protein [Aquisalinus flavus]|uniref:PHB granule-associated protein phasin2 n=1 Tax=Aquisalinus flavus TaxID=1526572 RepID=A0A8J2V564_9PROT|nr:phasin family protein [Aquisalinus flavus]MBD0427893.1 phasin family protein [Aquisalinus flavus]UNE47654.1 phasin family protein [Aquisalinus flavus]GGD04702.1 PHB granule-associated protein phasin2 [Aquisalinus flavus]
MSAAKKAQAETVDAANDVAKKFEEKMKDYSTQASATMKENMEKMSKGMAEFGEFGKDNVEAVVASASTFAKGFEDIATEQANYAKSSMEKSVEQMKTVASAKTPQDFMEAQTDYVRSAFESNMSQMNKLSDMWIATAKDCTEPLSRRYTAMVEKVQSFRV